MPPSPWPRRTVPRAPSRRLGRRRAAHRVPPVHEDEVDGPVRANVQVRERRVQERGELARGHLARGHGELRCLTLPPPQTYQSIGTFTGDRRCHPRPLAADKPGRGGLRASRPHTKSGGAPAATARHAGDGRPRASAAGASDRGHQVGPPSRIKSISPVLKAGGGRVQAGGLQQLDQITKFRAEQTRSPPGLFHDLVVGDGKRPLLGLSLSPVTVMVGTSSSPRRLAAAGRPWP